MSTLNINKLNYFYDDREVLKDITFKVKMPSLISVIGSNNCGKTTLIKCLSGIMPIGQSVSIDDIILNRKNIKKYSRCIGVVFSLDQNQFLFDKVLDEITFPLANLNYKKSMIKKSIIDVSNLLFLDDILDEKISELNCFEKLKVLIAVSVVHRPKVLLLDDIFIGLNEKEKEKIILMIKRIVKEFEMIVILTSSSLGDCIYSDAILVIEDGMIKYSGNLDDILMHDNDLTKLGINIPIMMDMSVKLQFYDLLDKVILNAEEMVDELWD